jgi:RNA-directed DNA polymerase
MNRWAPNLYKNEAVKRGVAPSIYTPALKQALKLQDAGLPAVLSLGHIAFHTGVPYKYLRSIVTRKFDPYRTFSIRKRSGGRRYINVPCDKLLRVQRWIDQYILSKLHVSPYSYAYNKNQKIIKCAEQHLKCTWLIKIDLRLFFESLSEIQVYKVFADAGYGALVSFEMARLCTKVLDHIAKKYQKTNWISRNNMPIHDYNDKRIGHLPQGAPTSPKLANLIVQKLDFEIADLIKDTGLTYTRYADDLILSTCQPDFTRQKGLETIKKIYKFLPKYGLRPNTQKAQIIPPGARKIVLGLLVDSDKVRLSKSFRNTLECHLFYSAKDALIHAQQRKFDSVLGLKNYVNGLLAYAKQIDPEYTSKILTRNSVISWPL